MYLYIYDKFVQEKKYEREMAAIENRLTDLGIAGKIIRMALFRQPAEQIRDEARRGVSSVVLVGGDQTLSLVLDAISEVNLPLGFIPIGPKNNFAKMLGIPEGVAACDILAARMIERLDLGFINGQKFVTGVTINHHEATMLCEGKYRVRMMKAGQIEIRNLAPVDARVIEKVANPQDGWLEAHLQVVQPGGFFKRRLSLSCLPFRRAIVEAPETFDVYCDGRPISGQSFKIAIEPLKLKVITGRQRMF